MWESVFSSDSVEKAVLRAVRSSFSSVVLKRLGQVLGAFLAPVEKPLPVNWRNQPGAFFFNH